MRPPADYARTPAGAGGLQVAGSILPHVSIVFLFMLPPVFRSAASFRSGGSLSLLGFDLPLLAPLCGTALRSSLLCGLELLPLAPARGTALRCNVSSPLFPLVLTLILLLLRLPDLRRSLLLLHLLTVPLYLGQLLILPFPLLS